MTASALYAIAGAATFGLGVGGVFFAAHVVRRILAANLAGSGVFLVLIALAARSPSPDPVPHALVLTGIVVSVSATGLALAIVRRIAEHEA